MYFHNVLLLMAYFVQVVMLVISESDKICTYLKCKIWVASDNQGLFITNDPNDHLYKIFQQKQCIVERTQDLLLNTSYILVL